MALSCALTAAAALALLPTSAEAGGDSVYGNRGGEQLVERGHEIALTMDRGHASLRVRRTVHNGIGRHDEAQFWLELPWTAVATGLRTLGEHEGKPKWFAGDLLEAEAAAARYQELTGIGGYYPKDPALLSWRGQQSLALQVFPVAPGTDKSVEYTLDMPAVWEDGRWRIELPDMGSAALAAELVIDPAQALDQLFVDGEVVANGHALTLDHPVEVALAPRDPDPFTLELASIPTGERHLAHWQLALAPKISTVPTRARVVVMIDVSRSIDEDQLAAQRQAALAYLEHFADPALGAEVAVLSFDREVRSLGAGFVSAKQAIELLTNASLQRRNGSELGLALARADELLRAGPRRGARRILMLTDLETASRIKPEDLRATAEHSEAILHLARVTEAAEPWLERDDQHPWSQLAAATEGVLWSGTAPEAWSDDERRQAGLAVFEELARPTRVDKLAIRVDGLELDDPDLWVYYDTSLAEGQGIEDLQLSSAAGRELSVDGVTWNAPIHHSAKPSAEAGDRWSALVFGSGLVWELSEPEMMTLAMRGGAVSPVTSYLAIEPGVRPSTEGLEAWESGGIGLGLGGGGARGFSVSGCGGPAAFDKQAWLEAELREGWARCGGAGRRAQLQLETHSQELLEVALSQAPADDEGLRACMTQIAWSVELPGGFAEFETWTVTLL
ncbi:hypothetical protein ENSA5_13550 [Enhygromyxa salina]|uniref:VWFA domain-containing protein n=1 Tax=Enhygromyxa salina TaxID=215803 RepID=A0A2S9YF45_9BACT|nr:vWA domain-containing protein [Enhygromyxa salina]PRQ03662.1 hypothetical protein ENSA5_13550 [Enhygromyxa salina]